MNESSYDTRAVSDAARRTGNSSVEHTLCDCAVHAHSFDHGMPRALHAQADFKLLRGQPKSFRSSETGTRQFCPDCGTQLFFLEAESPDEIETTIARHACPISQGPGCFCMP